MSKKRCCTCDPVKRGSCLGCKCFKKKVGCTNCRCSEIAQCQNNFKIIPSPRSGSEAVQAYSDERKLVREVRVVRQPGRYEDFTLSNDSQDASSDDEEEESSDSSEYGTDSEVEKVSRKVVNLSLADVLSVGSPSAIPLQLANEPVVLDESLKFSLPAFLPAHEPDFEWGILFYRALMP